MAITKKFECTCTVCGKIYQSGRAWKNLFCSEVCRRAYNQRKLLQQLPATLTCPICGRHVDRKSASQKYCGTTCQRVAHQRWKRTRRKQWKQYPSNHRPGDNVETVAPPDAIIFRGGGKYPGFLLSPSRGEIQRFEEVLAARAAACGGQNHRPVTH